MADEDYARRAHECLLRNISMIETMLEWLSQHIPTLEQYCTHVMRCQNAARMDPDVCKDCGLWHYEEWRKREARVP